MLPEDGQGRLAGMHGQGAAPHVPHGIHHQGQGRHMVQVGMGQEDMVDGRQLGNGKVHHPGARIDQHVMIEEHGGGAQMPASDPAAATEYA